jgi:hypothetical protein
MHINLVCYAHPLSFDTFWYFFCIAFDAYLLLVIELCTNMFVILKDWSMLMIFFYFVQIDNQ